MNCKHWIVGKNDNARIIIDRNVAYGCTSHKKQNRTKSINGKAAATCDAPSDCRNNNDYAKRNCPFHEQNPQRMNAF